MIALELVKQTLRDIEEISNKEGLSGIPTGFIKLDKLTSGWQSSELITIGARAGMGKTSFALSMAINISVDKDIPLLYFSIESSSISLVTKLISMETGLSLHKLKTGKLEKYEWEQLNVKVKGIEKAPLFIDDTPSINIDDLLCKISSNVEDNNIRIVIIDYLQLITLDTKNYNAVNREQEISIIIKKFKGISKALNIPIILLSQLSRAVETRGGNKRPLLSDLRESGAIEDDSDIVCFLYRPEYYKIDEWDDEERSPCEGQAEFIVAKNKNGGLENIRLKFIQHMGKFDNLEDYDSPFEFHASMNYNSFKTDNFKASPDQAFGSSFNDDEESDVPF